LKGFLVRTDSVGDALNGQADQPRYRNAGDGFGPAPRRPANGSSISFAPRLPSYL